MGANRNSIAEVWREVQITSGIRCAGEICSKMKRNQWPPMESRTRPY